MKLNGLTGADISGVLAGFDGSLEDLELIDTITWEADVEGVHILTTTWTDNHPAGYVDGLVAGDDLAAQLKAAVATTDTLRRTHWGPRYIEYVANQDEARIEGPKEYVYRSAAH